MEDDDKKATIESCHVLIKATPEGVEISTLDGNGDPNQTIAFNGEKLTIKADVVDEWNRGRL